MDVSLPLSEDNNFGVLAIIGKDFDFNQDSTLQSSSVSNKWCYPIPDMVSVSPPSVKGGVTMRRPIRNVHPTSPSPQRIVEHGEFVASLNEKLANVADSAGINFAIDYGDFSVINVMGRLTSSRWSNHIESPPKHEKSNPP